MAIDLRRLGRFELHRDVQAAVTYNDGFENGHLKFC